MFVLFGRFHLCFKITVFFNSRSVGATSRSGGPACAYRDGPRLRSLQRSHGNNVTHAKTLGTEIPDSNARKSRLRATRIVGALA